MIQAYAPTSNNEEVEAEWFYEDLQELLELTPKKDVHDPDNHYGVITHHKASGGDGIPAELFQILKDDVVKVLHSICQQIWKTQQWPQDWKRSVFIPIPKKGNAKECSNYHTIALISHALLCSKFSNLGFNNT